AVIEIKLAKNAESRRAVIAQILTYAAFLRGMSLESLEQGILKTQLAKRGHETISAALAEIDQEGSIDKIAFEQQLRESLRLGRFRLILVLDAAPAELVRLVGYLGAVSDKLVIDLITVAAYQIGTSQVVVPQRVDPERPEETKLEDQFSESIR